MAVGQSLKAGKFCPVAPMSTVAARVPGAGGGLVGGGVGAGGRWQAGAADNGLALLAAWVWCWYDFLLSSGVATLLVW